MQKVELLSPARDLVVGKAAIDNGADAVYIGAPAFGARKAAANSLEDIGTLVRYAHRFYCRVFVTLNTILYDSELAEAEKMIRQLYAIGVDALIIQDPGILNMDLPPICLHASTQMHNYELERIKFLDQLGFQRIGPGAFVGANPGDPERGESRTGSVYTRGFVCQSERTMLSLSIYVRPLG